MQTAHSKMIDKIRQKMGRKKLVWFGTRGTDSQALLHIENFTELFSLIAPLGSLAVRLEVCLEEKIRRRVDLDNYRIDDDKSEEAMSIHKNLYRSLADESYLVSYRPSNFLTSIYFPRSKNVEYLGQFFELQDAFEHKPWVETELRKLNVQTIPWDYLGDEDINVVKERLESEKKQVIRSSRSDGGAGLYLVETPEQVDEIWKPHSDFFFAVAPYLEPSIPLNVNAVVFPDSTVSLHSPSLQLIGIQSCTNRRFGYCGNDFAKVRDLPLKIFEKLETYVTLCGKWLASQKYYGAFGVDALVYNDQVYVTEINPRFQGSSDLSSVLDYEMGRPDMFLEHIAAFLHIDLQPEKMCLRDMAQSQAKVSQVICHNTAKVPLRRNNEPSFETDMIRYKLLPSKSIIVDPEAILFRAVVSDCVTTDGNLLNTSYNTEIQHAISNFFVNS